MSYSYFEVVFKRCLKVAEIIIVAIVVGIANAVTTLSRLGAVTWWEG